jgi:hypothetical protein
MKNILIYEEGKEDGKCNTILVTNIYTENFE